MFNVRKGVFETNSSSVHAMVICTKKEFDDVRGGKLLIDDGDRLITWQEAKKRLHDRGKYSWDMLDAMSDNDLAKALEDCWIAWTYQDWGEYYEDFSQSYTTPKGEEIVAFGYSGRDG